MAKPISSRPLERYLGNTKTKEVHDLLGEVMSCQVDAIIRAGHAVVFSPDTLEQAARENYTVSRCCIACDQAAASS